eukprot:m.169786 g.169786  ORF g.169786 m.169786 type:complete len:107 (+) comp14507_c0_seq5:437-757(+)
MKYVGQYCADLSPTFVSYTQVETSLASLDQTFSQRTFLLLSSLEKPSECTVSPSEVDSLVDTYALPHVFVNFHSDASVNNAAKKLAAFAQIASGQHIGVSPALFSF